VSERVEARGSVQLGWPGGRPRRPARVVEHAIAAIEALRPAFRPTLFQINLRLRGSDELPGRWLWSLEERGFEDGLDGEGGGDDGEVVFRVVDRVGRDAMEALGREALADGDSVDISSISVEVRSVRPGARPVEMEIWALSDLSIDMDWPLGDGGESPAEIDRAVARLVALGWRVDEEPADLVLAGEEDDDGPVRSDRPVSLQLSWTGSGADQPLGAAMIAVDAVAAFAPLLAPASAAVEVAFPDLARVRPDRFRFAHAQDGMELEAIRRLAREALAPQRAAGLTGRLRGLRPVDWSEIAVGLRPPGAEPPDPVVLVFARRAALLLEVQLCSADWSDPASVGRDRVERVVASLARGGWKRAPDRP
jgi:hypothetical protein